MKPTIHQKFIKNLKNSFKEFHLIPNDGYLLEHVAMHLWNANLHEILHDLLLDFHWIQHQVAENQLSSLIGDYSYFSNDFEMTLIQKSLLLSSHVILSDKSQLGCHLQARLVDFASSSKSVSSLLYSIDSTLSGTFWLKASKSILQSPNTSLIQTLVGHSSRVTTVSITPDGSKVISGSYDNTIKIWNINTGEELKTLNGHSSSVTAVSITPDGSKIISGSYDNTLKIWNINTGEELKTLKGHSSLVNAVSITPDGSKVISGSYDNTLKIWNINTGEELKTLKGHSFSVNAVSITPDGSKVISGSYDNTLKIWNINTGEELKTLNGHSYSVKQFQLHQMDQKSFLALMTILSRFGISTLEKN